MGSLSKHPLLVEHLKADYKDNDVRQIARLWDKVKPKGTYCLVLGAADEPLADCIQALGWNVLGIDLRPSRVGAIYAHEQTDFFLWDRYLRGSFWECAVAVSTLEHGGLWEGGHRDMYGDVWASRKLYELLSPGGLLFVTVPVGKTFKVEHDWRRYTRSDLDERIIGPFDILEEEYYWTSIEGNYQASLEDVNAYERSADLSAVLVLQKPLKPRIVGEEVKTL